MESETVRVRLSSDSELFVDIKKWLTYGEAKAINEARGRGTTEEEKSNAFADALLEMAIVGWNLKDKDGKNLEVTKDTIEDLPFADVQVIVQKAAESVKVAPADPNSSTASSRGSRRTGRSR